MRVKELAKILAEDIKSERDIGQTLDYVYVKYRIHPDDEVGVEVMSESDVEYIDRLENIIEELENQVYLLRSAK